MRTKCPAGWTAWNSLDTFTTEGNGGGSGSNTITVRVVLDDYGSETSWELYDDTFTVINSDGPFSDGQSGTEETKTFDLADGCYTLYLDDSYGDGICCAYGDGSLEVLLDGQVIAESDGYFGYYDQMDFCITSNGFRTGEHKKDVKQTRQSAKPAPKVLNK